MKVYKLASKEEILSLSKSFYELLKKPSSSAKMEMAAELGQLLLKPIEQIIDGKSLIIIRDDMLHYIPFSALIVGGTELIKKHEITYHLSASVLASIRRQAKEKTVASKGVVLVADPVFDTSDLRLKVNKNRKHPFVVRNSNKEVIRDNLERVFSNKDSFLPRLPFSRIEAETIASMLLPNEYKYFFGFNANKRNILDSNFYQFRVIHFGTHGFISSKNPSISGLVLSLINENGEPQDGLLQLHDIFNLKLSAELVVLSACQTGLGKQIKGEGLVGLTRGFMYAGASSVLTTLWNTEDRVAAKFMAVFYKELLQNGQKPSLALRRAQLQFLETDKWKDPYYWSAFQLQGE